MKKKNIFYSYQQFRQLGDTRIETVENKSIFTKNKIKYLNLMPYDLGFDYFKENLINMNFIGKNKLYAFLIKIKKDDGNFSMAGNHDI